MLDKKIKKDEKYIFFCPTCKKEFFDHNYVKNRKFCSPKCRRTTRTQSQRLKMSNIAKERGFGKWMKGRVNNPWLEKSKSKMSKAMNGRRTSQNTEFKAGYQHSNWKGGIKIALKRRWQKVKNNPRLKLRQNFSCLLSMKLKRRLLSKRGKSTFDFLPYTVDDLILHLEKLFTKGMTWKNYGEWHIDHKIPDSSFNYKSTKDINFQKSWSLENLQPLWAKDNLVKGKKIL